MLRAMSGNKKINRKLSDGCRAGCCAERDEQLHFDNLFEREWDVFVVKRTDDGRFVARVACCALAPV